MDERGQAVHHRGRLRNGGARVRRRNLKSGLAVGYRVQQHRAAHSPAGKLPPRHYVLLLPFRERLSDRGTIASKGSVSITSHNQNLGALCSGSGNFWIGFQATDGHDYYSNQVTLGGTQSSPALYHAGKQVSIVSQATGGVTGHAGPGNQYQVGPTNYPKSSPIWIVCHINGQSIAGPYGTEAIWDLSDDGWYYSDAWIYTGTNGPAVPPCSLKTATISARRPAA